MCTAVTFQTKDHYFGRNLDLEYHYQEAVTITPRYFPLSFRNQTIQKAHYALIGMATIADNYPLYYDATNEKGLSMAGLNFPGNAVYQPCKEKADNIAPFEFIPWILSQCATVNEAFRLLNQLNLADIPFSEEFPQSPLHWILADSTHCLVIEPLIEGIKIHENPVGVLTNNPPFDYHIHNLTNYLHLTREEPINHFAPQLSLTPFSRGLGAVGLPGDLSSPSRFIRAAYTKFNSVCKNTESDSITQFFHILQAVAQQEGCVPIGEHFEKTVYSSCCNTNLGIYYYKTYENSQITAVDMHQENLNGADIISYPLIKSQKICYLNK